MDEKPLTRAELVELLAGLKTDLKTDLDAKLQLMKQDLIAHTEETVRDAQTEILRAFYPFQENTNIQLRAMKAKLSNTDTEISARMAVLERRLAEIEKKLMMDPPAA